MTTFSDCETFTNIGGLTIWRGVVARVSLISPQPNCSQVPLVRKKGTPPRGGDARNTGASQLTQTMTELGCGKGSNLRREKSGRKWTNGYSPLTFLCIEPNPNSQ